MLHRDPRESDGFQPPRQLFRVNRHELVSDVSAPGPLVVVALRSDQNSARAQNAQQLGEDSVLDDGRYVTGITVPVDAGFTNKR